MLTVLFATHNGAHQLGAVLDAYRAIETPRGGWQLVVVDNASTDASRTIAEQYQGSLPLTVVHESQLGKNAALNNGLGHVRGDLVVLTDDDVFPRPDWLCRLRAAADAHPEADIFGGCVVARWEREPERWVLDWVPLSPVFALSSSVRATGPATSGDVLGPNMAVRASLIERGLRFDVNIGPRGPSYPMGSETELVSRVLSGGGSAWFVADAVVEHLVRAAQLDERWILRRAVRYGRGQYRLGFHEQPASTPRWHGVPRHLYREMAGAIWSAALGYLTGNRERNFRARWDFNVARGRAIEARVLGS